MARKRMSRQVKRKTTAKGKPVHGTTKYKRTAAKPRVAVVLRESKRKPALPGQPRVVEEKPRVAVVPKESKRKPALLGQPGVVEEKPRVAVVPKESKRKPALPGQPGVCVAPSNHSSTVNANTSLFNKGFKNRKNDCYAIALLQVMLSQQLFSTWIVCFLTPDFSPWANSLLELAMFFLSLSDPVERNLNFAMASLIDNLCNGHLMFPENSQQDIFDMLSGLLTALSEIDSPSLNSLFEIRVKPGAPTCRVCSRKLNRESDPTKILIIYPNDGRHTVQQAIDNGLEESFTFRCCGLEQGYTGMAKFENAPKILNVQISRFESKQNVRTKKYYQLKNRIAIGISKSLSYVKEGTPKTEKYNLAGFVCHTGKSIRTMAITWHMCVAPQQAGGLQGTTKP